MGTTRGGAATGRSGHGEEEGTGIGDERRRLIGE
jgi:hypothetical protein